MPFRRSTWQQELEASRAAHILRVGRPDEFPLSKLQTLTDTHLLASTGARPIQPCTPEADDAIFPKLDQLAGRLRHYEAGLLSTLHALSPQTARRRVCGLVPDPASADEHFDARVAIYLQVLILAHKARGQLACTDDECRAAWELFIVVRKAKRGALVNVSSIWRALQASVDGKIDDVLPISLIKAVLSRSKYTDYFQAEITHLRESCQWAKLYGLVAGGAKLVKHPDIVSLALPTSTFSDVLTWRPNQRRIELWASKLDPKQYCSVAPILNLEGPDTTKQQRGTLRQSSPGQYVLLQGSLLNNGFDLLGRLLDAFDRAVSIGPDLVQRFAYACAYEPHLKTSAYLDDAIKIWDNPGHPRRHAALSEAPSAPRTSTTSKQPAPSTWTGKALDPYRDALYTNLKQNVKNLPSELLDSCIKQSLNAQDEFVRGITDRVMSDNDQVCVNLGIFLGRHAKNTSAGVHECWKRLLMHMMRQRPVGMMDRCGKNLLWETWSSWVDSLRVLYAEQHFNPTEGLGFTKDGFAKWTSQKRKPTRAVSTASTPSGSVESSRHLSVARTSSTATGEGRQSGGRRQLRRVSDRI